jgi:class 3 adenylate cyclase
LAVERRLSAILAVDVVGYSRLMEADEAATFERLRAHRKELFEPEIARHHGRIFKLMGDGLLAEFASVVDAVECAVLLQREMAERNNGLADDRRIDVRMGLHVGDVIVEGDDRHGDAVIIASRLQQLAESGGICVSGAVADHVRHKVALRFERRGEERLKNIAEPVAVYRIDQPSAAKPRSNIMKWSAAAALPVLLAAAIVVYLLVSPDEPPAPPAATVASARPAPASAATPSGQTALVAPPASPSSDVGSAPSKDQGIPVIVVLPFQDLTGDQTQSDLGKGIAEAFITDLATFPDFEVISSTSSFAYAGKPVPEIVKATGALFVIEGSLR